MTTKKDVDVSEFLAELCRTLGTLDGVKVKWPDGRIFKHVNGKWTVYGYAKKSVA